MANYKFTLTPIDQFFFGGEKHNADGETTNYFVESNPYPQQTTLLGLVRYFLLLKHNLLGTDRIKSEGKDLIGSNSFDFDADIQLFGKIGFLSSLYFMKNSLIYVPSPLDVEYDIINGDNDYYLKKGEGKFKAKDGFPSLKVVDLSGNVGPSITGRRAIDDCIVFPAQHTGNEKGDNGATKEDAFYKQVYMKMKPDWSFAFDVVINEQLMDETLYINFGGEKSLFSLKVKGNVEPIKLKSELKIQRLGLYGFYCISDCFTEPKILKNTCFAINKSISFRNFQSTIKTKNYAVYNKKDPEGMVRGNRFNLLARGSALYFKTEAERDDALKLLNKQNCINIGFNNYLKIN